MTEATHPVVRARSVAPLDLSRTSTLFSGPADYTELPRFTRVVERALADASAGFGVGGYLEDRALYTTPRFAEAGRIGARARCIHLGLDIWGPAGTPVYVPLPGRIHSFADNGMGRNYGPTIVLEHAGFYTLYGHLARASLTRLVVGREVRPGARLATFGGASENGGWPPHLHFQVIRDLQGYVGDYPGVCFAEEREAYAANCPDPRPLAGV